MIFKRFAKLLFLTAIFSAINPCVAREDLGFVVARVNNHIITYSDLNERYSYVLLSSNIKVNSPEERQILLNQVIDKMVDEELIRQEANKLNIRLEESEIDQVIENIVSRQKKTVAEYKKQLAQKGLSFVAYRNQIKSDIYWSKIVSDSLRSRIKITDFEIKEFFEQKKMSTDVTKYLIAEVVIPNDGDAKLLGQKLSDELKNGADFKTIVRQFSRSPTVDNSGELGWVSKNNIDSRIFESICKLDKNGYSDAVLINDSYYIFKILDKKLVTEIKENDMVNARNIIFARQLEIEAKRYLMDMRKSSFIEVDRATLK